MEGGVGGGGGSGGGGVGGLLTQEASPLVWLSAQPVKVSLWFHKCDNKLSGINHSCFVAACRSHVMQKVITTNKYLCQHHLNLGNKDLHTVTDAYE